MPALEAIKRLVENGLGVALIPHLAAQIEIERKQLAGVTVREMRLERRMHLIYRRGGSLSHAAKGFLRGARGTRGEAGRQAVWIRQGVLYSSRGVDGCERK